MDDKKSELLANLENRTGTFRRNVDLDELLEELSALLSPVDRLACGKLSEPRMPPLLLLGNPRSGTTLFMQVVARAGGFAVPTNLLSRFYYAPYIGAKIQLLLTDPRFDYKGELGDFATRNEYASSLGKTKGTLQPSEFFHFWRQFIPNYDPRYVDAEEARLIEWRQINQAISAIECTLERPFASKTIILQYNIREMSSGIANHFFVYVRRNPFYVMQSILLAREHFYGDREKWWSVMPREYEELKLLSVYEQIAGQVFFTEQAIAVGLSEVSEERKLEVDYEDLCNEPSEVYSRVRAAYEVLGTTVSGDLDTSLKFPCSDVVRLSSEDVAGLVSAYERVSGESLKL